MSGEHHQDDMPFSEADLASVVQQAMEGIEQEALQEQQQSSAAAESQDVIDHNQQMADFEREFQKHMDEQFAQQQEPAIAEQTFNEAATNTTTTAAAAAATNDEDDDFAKEVERQLQAQFEQQQQLHGHELAESLRHGLTIDDSVQHQSLQPDQQSLQTESVSIKTTNDTSVDYEQELQRQIMHALNEPQSQAADAASSVAPAPADPDFERDLQQQIMAAFNATEEIQQQIESQPPAKAPELSKDAVIQESTSRHDTPVHNLMMHDDDDDDEPEQQDDYELELQDQILQAFADAANERKLAQQQARQRPVHQQSVQPKADEPRIQQQVQPQAQQQVQEQVQRQIQQQVHDQIQHQLRQAQEQAQQQANQEQQDEYERELQNTILQSLHGHQDSASADIQADDLDDPFKDALAELVRNVVDGDFGERDEQQEQLVLPPGDDEGIDMNQIMQNALALAVEDPSALLQSMNAGESQQELIGQLLTQSLEQPKTGKKKATKASKEKKPPKEKKPKQPRKTTKKKKEQPVVSQVPNFVPAGPQFTIPGIPFPQNLQHLPQSLQVQFQQQIQQQQKLLQQQQEQQRLLTQLQQSQQQPQQQQLQVPSNLQVSEPSTQVHIPQQVPPPPSSLPPSHQHQQLQQLLNVSPPLSKSPVDKIEPKQPKPAPPNSIIDSVKKAPPLVLLSKDTSIDLANSSKQKKKTSLSIAETLALSRSTMSSGKYVSKLQSEKATEKEVSRPSEDTQPRLPAQLSQAQVPAVQLQVQQTSVVPDLQQQVPQHTQFQQLPAQTNVQRTSVGDVSLYTFPTDQQGESSNLDSALSLATQMFKKSSVSEPVESTSSGMIGQQSNSSIFTNRIGATLPNVPMELTNLIGAAITQALANTQNDGQRDTYKTKQKQDKEKKPVIPKDETPEQMRERVRLENRERKKRWRDANKLKNQNNDLRARLKKRAIQLFGPENSDKKTEWIETEFEKRKNRRIIRKANLDDLTAVITENMSKMEVSTVTPETLSRVIGQLVSSMLNQTPQPSTPPAPEKDIVEDIPGVPGSAVSAFKVQSEPIGKAADVSLPSKLPEIELSALLSNVSQYEQGEPSPVMPQNDIAAPAVQQPIAVPQASRSAITQQFVPPVPTQAQTPAPVDTAVRTTSVIQQVKILPQKRNNEFLSNFSLKKAKIPLISLRKNLDEDETKEGAAHKPEAMAPEATAPEATTPVVLTQDSASTTAVSPIERAVRPSSNPSASSASTSASSASTSVNTSTPAVTKPVTPIVSQEQTPPLAQTTKPMGKAIAVVSVPVPTPASVANPKNIIARPVPFKKEPVATPATPAATTWVPLASSSSASSPKTETRLARPKFGVPKKPTFGLRKPGAFQRPPERPKKVGTR